MYQIKELADLAGVTARTLRYYHQIGLLIPHSINESGHRFYSQKEVKDLQQILFLKELNFTLEETKELMLSENNNRLTFFTEQHKALLEKQSHLENVIKLIEKTIDEEKGKLIMTDRERFEAFKKKQIKDNREKYGEEIISKYGEQAVKDSEKKFSALSKEDLTVNMKEIEEKMFTLLRNDIECPSEEAFTIYNLHKEWLSYSLDLTPEIHLSLVDMYLADPRFTAYYDEKVETGTTQKLRDIVYFYAK